MTEQNPLAPGIPGIGLGTAMPTPKITSTAGERGAPAGMATEIRLSQPITMGDNQITTITLREPNFGDWLDCGEIADTILHDVDPSNFSLNSAKQKVEVRPNPKAVMAWFTRLSGLRANVLRQISVADFRKIYEVIQVLVGEADPGN